MISGERTAPNGQTIDVVQDELSRFAITQDEGLKSMSPFPWVFHIAHDEDGYYWQRLNVDGSVHSDGRRRFRTPGEARDEAAGMDGQEEPERVTDHPPRIVVKAPDLPPGTASVRQVGASGGAPCSICGQRLEDHDQAAVFVGEEGQTIK